MAGRGRTIKPAILEDDKTAAMDDSTWRLWVSLWLIADDYGNLRGEPAMIRAAVFWARDVPIASVAKSIETLMRLSMVSPYTVRGQSYLSIVNWTRHQYIQHPSKPQMPGPAEADPKGLEPVGTAATRPHESSHEESHESLNAIGKDRIGEEVADSPELAAFKSLADSIGEKATATDAPKRGKRAKKPETAIDPDWRPPTPYDQQAFEEFRDWTLSKGITYADWNAAWRNNVRTKARWAAEARAKIAGPQRQIKLAAPLEVDGIPSSVSSGINWSDPA